MPVIVDRSNSPSPQPIPGLPAEGSSTHRPPLAVWLLFAGLTGWLALLVILPTAILILYSFCSLDDDGNVAYTFTFENYQRILGENYHPLLWKLIAAVAIGVLVLLLLNALLRRGSSFAAARTGAALGLASYLSYAVHLGVSPGPYVKIFWRSAELAGMTTLICLLAGFPVAYFVGRSPPRWRNRLLATIMIPFWTSFLIRTYAWITILNQHGLLNAALHAFHLSVLIPESGALLYTPTAVVIGLVYAYLPFMILPIYGSVEKLDESLLEAALDLGATPWRTLLRVVLPLCKPGIISGVLLVFVPSIGMFAVTDLLGGKTQLIGTVIENQFGQAHDWPFGSALGVSLIAAFLLVYAFTGRRSEAA